MQHRSGEQPTKLPFLQGNGPERGGFFRRCFLMYSSIRITLYAVHKKPALRRPDGLCGRGNAERGRAHNTRRSLFLSYTPLYRPERGVRNRVRWRLRLNAAHGKLVYPSEGVALQVAKAEDLLPKGGAADAAQQIV